MCSIPYYRDWNFLESECIFYFMAVGDTEVTRDRLYQRDVNNFTLHRKRK